MISQLIDITLGFTKTINKIDVLNSTKIVMKINLMMINLHQNKY